MSRAVCPGALNGFSEAALENPAYTITIMMNKHGRLHFNATTDDYGLLMSMLRRVEDLIHGNHDILADAADAHAALKE